MKAIVLDLSKDRKPFIEMRDVPMPIIAPDEVLVKVAVVSICGTDVSIAKYVPAMQKRIPKLPHILGHEFAGNIVELGENVGQEWKIGDYVSAETHIYCDKCPTCVSGNKHLCPGLKVLGVDRNGCFAEYVAVPHKVLKKNREDLPYGLASIQEPLGNVAHCLNEADVKGKNILIVGDGPAALFAVAVAKSRIFGAEDVTIMGYNDFRLEIAEELGAIALNSFNLDMEFIGDYVHKDAGGRYGVVFEFTGSDSGINLAVDACEPSGKIMSFGLSENEKTLMPYNKIVFKGITVKGIYGRRIWSTWGLVETIVAEEECRARIERVVTNKLAFNDFMEGFNMMSAGVCGKVILVF